MSEKMVITLEQNAKSWTHHQKKIDGAKLRYSSKTIDVYYLKSCHCKADHRDVAYQACLAMQALGLNCGDLIGVMPEIQQRPKKVSPKQKKMFE
jgi:hypothetical protein